MRRPRSGLGGWTAVLLATLAGCSHPSTEVVSTAPAPPAPVSVVPPRPASARDAYVLLSGGGTPLTNNYSQYLQAQAIAAFFERECPPGSTWVFFGAGNREGMAPVLADTRREVRRDGWLVQSWLTGTLKNNRTATRDSFLRALREEILPTVRDGGTLYLFVGDHGELAGTDDKRESAITMWQLRWRRRAGNWETDETEVLGVAELRSVIAQGIGRGRVVFCMTQCHAGGFHELGVMRDPAPPRAWFASPPSNAVASPTALRLPIAGYTATDEASPAAGCDADPDPERWAGYERFMPESLFGHDLMTGQPKSAAAPSFAIAHERATLVDQTIDKPRATSEHYLEAWARVIETQLAATLSITGKTQQAVLAYQRAVDRGELTATVPASALAARRDQFARFTERLAEQAPAAKTLLLSGTRQQLEASLTERSARGGPRGGRRGSGGELRRTWTETLRPAWKAAVGRGMVLGLSGPALQFEKQLLELEDGGRNFFMPRGRDDDALLNEVYWKSGYADPRTLDLAKAEAITSWAVERRSRIVAWGVTFGDPPVKAAAEKLGAGPPFVEEPPRPLARKTAAERVLFYRRVLGAWQFLLMMDAQPALAELQTLIDLEATPIRPRQ